MCRKGVHIILILIVSLFSFGQNTKPKPTAKSSAYIMHVVKFGETLTKISQKYGVSKTEILKANPSLTPDNLNPEQILRIPNVGNKKTVVKDISKDEYNMPTINGKKATTFRIPKNEGIGFDNIVFCH